MPMPERYTPPTNRGCLIAFAIGLPLLIVTFLFAALDAGRCEGQGPDCRPEGPPYGLIFLGIIVGSFALAWWLGVLFNRRRDGAGEEEEASAEEAERIARGE